MTSPLTLPTFKGYTIDIRLRQFRLVDINKPSIEFIDFDSEKGQELFEEFAESLDNSKPEDRKLLFEVANAMIKKY